MVIKVVKILIVSIIVFSSSFDSARAQDRNGDYFFDNLPTDGTYIYGRWEVVNSEPIPCVLRPGDTNSMIQISKGDILTIPVSIGPVSNVDPIYLDSQGNPWMIATETNGDRFANGGICYVRANEEYLVPSGL